MTVASLKDLGYVVDMTKAEPYSLPNHLRLAEGGLLAAAHVHADGLVLPTVPMILPEHAVAEP